ncbi:cell division protein ZipA [Litorilituus sediminis]|uniref:Cell division protein ZipA n=1 Tax=Litorilituus sediminis TaxID=718192 RepID=A0A4P6P0H6_9GAMM|nr:cell division protein ZipA [Litorilituus sediminis]QBG34264.1 cell division protein ZipA [Litorilituus sediminis]
MEDNFRNVLIILSGIVIGAIFVHGLWTIRKQKNPYKLKTSKDKVEPLTRNFDGSGFDQDGVGQVKVSKKAVEPSLNDNETSTIDDIVTSTPLDSTQAINEHIEPVIEQNNPELAVEATVNTAETLAEHSTMANDVAEPTLSDWVNEAEPNTKAFSKEELGDDITQRVEQAVNIQESEQPVYQEPVTQAKPQVKPVKKVAKKAQSKAALKRNQMDFNFGDELMGGDIDEPMPSISVDDKPAKEVLEPQVIILSVVMPANQQMMGAALLPSLLTLGMKYGDMNIFHRHQDNAGNGKVTFSLANMMNPGSFDLDSMETFATQGVSLFMTLPNAGDPFAVFEQMLAAAKQLAQEFNAQVLDDKRNVMTKQTEQHYLSQIREFDRKSRIALVD